MIVAALFHKDKLIQIMNSTFYIAVIKNCLKFYSLDTEDVKGK